MTIDRAYADPEKAAPRLMQHAHAFEPVRDGRIYIEKLNGPFLYTDRATPAEYSAGLKFAIERGWLTMHESGTFVRSAKPVPTCSREGFAVYKAVPRTVRLTTEEPPLA